MSNNSENQEIDLSMIFKRMGNFLENQKTNVFKAIQFCIKNKLVLLLLIGSGIGLGIYLDTTSKTYKNQINVQPNFGSTDYLYSKIGLLQSKIKERDSVFLKAIGIKNPKNIVKIEVTPVVDVYQFINNTEDSKQNFDLLKLMTENTDIKKIVEDKTTSKNYRYHTISFVTIGKTTNETTVAPILNFLNNSDFYKKIQVENVNNLLLKIKANDTIISQIDGYLNSLATIKSSNLVVYTDKTQLNDVLQTKQNLINNQAYLRVQLVFYDKIIKDDNFDINEENKSLTNNKIKLILPLLFICMYLFISFFINFYKKQLQKSKSI